MDTHRDRQIVKAIFAELTSVSFATKLQGVKSRQGTTNVIKSIPSQLQRYKEIKTTSQVVRNDMTLSQQDQLTKRIIKQRKRLPKEEVGILKLKNFQS